MSEHHEPSARSGAKQRSSLDVNLVTAQGEPCKQEPSLADTWAAVRETLRALSDELAWSPGELLREGAQAARLDRMALRAFVAQGRQVLWDWPGNPSSPTYSLRRKQADSLWAGRLMQEGEQDLPVLPRAAFLDVLEWIASIMEADQRLEVSLGEAARGEAP